MFCQFHNPVTLVLSPKGPVSQAGFIIKLSGAAGVQEAFQNMLADLTPEEERKSY